MSLADLRAAVVPGDGVVARADDMIAVIITGSGADSQSAVCVVAGATAFVFGDISLTADTATGQVALNGAGATTGIAQELDEPITAIRVGGDRDPVALSNLTNGIVAGAGVVMTLAEEAVEPALETKLQEAVPKSVEPEPAPAADEEPVSDFEVFDLTASEEDRRDPLPVSTELPQPEETEPDRPPRYDDPVIVKGVFSSKGHFNHPNAKYCSRSGVRMGAHQTLVLTDGPRPPLGVLTFDDGSTYTVQWNTIIGRDPLVDELVTSESAASLVVADPEQTVSRAHAFLELRDWDVYVSDRGSQNGTFVKSSEADDWRRIATEERVELTSGAQVRVGEKTFVYSPHHII